MPTLLTLPPELREQIYLHTFTTAPSLNTTTNRLYPPEPPLTKVSHTLRRETLPIFYNSHPLSFNISIDRSTYNQIILRYHPWYRRLPSSRFQHIRHLKLQFNFLERYFGEPVTVIFDINFNRDSTGYSVSHAFPRDWWRSPHRKGDPEDCAEVISILRKHFEGTLDGLMGRAGVRVWKDLDRLLEIDPDTLP